MDWFLYDRGLRHEEVRLSIFNCYLISSIFETLHVVLRPWEKNHSILLESLSKTNFVLVIQRYWFAATLQLNTEELCVFFLNFLKARVMTKG